MLVFPIFGVFKVIILTLILVVLVICCAAADAVVVLFYKFSSLNNFFFLKEEKGSMCRKNRRVHSYLKVMREKQNNIRVLNEEALFVFRENTKVC